MSEPIQIWITKQCLSQGIEEARAQLFPTNPKWCIPLTGRFAGTILQSPDWHQTEAKARRKAQEMLTNSLKYHREKLEELESIPAFVSE